ncbi:MAG: DUF4145 domain-containing protein [Planctomycetota bacterium]|jgi:hypothetical protein
MPLPPKLHTKYIARFEELITEGNQLASLVNVQITREYGRFDFEQTGELLTNRDDHIDDRQRLNEWRTKCKTLFHNIIPRDSIHSDLSQRVGGFGGYLKDDIETTVAKLRAIKEEYEKGFLDDMSVQVEAAVISNLMGQAEELLNEGQPEKHDYVPAAVLAGAVLEKSLRTFCGQQKLPIPIVEANGMHKKMNVLIDDLKKAGLYVETKAKQLRAWAGIRNAAAHGEFDKFNKADVEDMIKGINRFLGDYM